jgi:hypothetical protein
MTKTIVRISFRPDPESNEIVQPSSTFFWDTQLSICFTEDEALFNGPHTDWTVPRRIIKTFEAEAR